MPGKEEEARKRRGKRGPTSYTSSTPCTLIVVCVLVFPQKKNLSQTLSVSATALNTQQQSGACKHERKRTPWPWRRRSARPRPGSRPGTGS
eukprot:3709698-Rhodomonas_salina.1